MAYRDLVLADNPEAYWRIGDTDGLPSPDETGNGHELTNGANFSAGAPPLVPGESDPSVEFAGSGFLRRELPAAFKHDPLDTDQPATLELWLMVESLPGAIQVPFSLQPRGSHFDGRGLALELNTNGRVTFRKGAGTGSFFRLHSPDNSIAVDTPHHVVGQTRGTEAWLWVDGVLVAYSDASGSFTWDDKPPPAEPEGDGPDPAQVYIGAEHNNNPGVDANTLFFTGFADEVAYYKHLLSPERIQIHAGILAPPAMPEPTEVEVNCEDVTLRHAPAEPIIAIRWRIATLDDPEFTAPVVDTGFVAPEYETAPAGSFFGIAIFSTTLDPGTYLAIVQVEVEGLGASDPSDPVRFTVLGFAVEFWGGFQVGAPS